jgi:hypothetical protein
MQSYGAVKLKMKKWVTKRAMIAPWQKQYPLNSSLPSLPWMSLAQNVGIANVGTSAVFN